MTSIALGPRPVEGNFLCHGEVTRSSESEIALIQEMRRMAVDDPIALFRQFAAGESARPVSMRMAQAVVAHIDALIEMGEERERLFHEAAGLLGQKATRDKV